MSNKRIETILKNMDADKAQCILELWAERSDVQKMVWGGRDYKDLNPTFAQELESIAKYIGKMKKEIQTLRRELEIADQFSWYDMN